MRQLRQNFFSRLKVLFYAGAGLQQYVWDELQAARRRDLRRAHHLPLQPRLDRDRAARARLHLGHPTGPAISACRRRASSSSWCRTTASSKRGCKGPNITPGYWRQPELTTEAFDEEGFYKIGDALKFADPADPSQGLLFDGRIAEDFKLSTGTWVSVGALRAQFIDHCAPLVRDAVIAGADRDDIAALVFPDVEACRRLAGLAADAPRRCGARRRRSCATNFAGGSTRWRKQSTGGSTRICRHRS